MYKIFKKQALSDSIYLMDVKADRVAKSCYPGQFVIVKMDEKGERIPLTVCDYDRENGTVTIVFQVVGASTEKMAQLNEGDSFRDFVGPLGNATETEGVKNVCVVGGGVGCAIAMPVAEKFAKDKANVTSVIGFRNKDLVILEDEFKKASKELVVMTDDGSYGLKGNVNDMIKELINNQGKKYDLVIAIGPVIMMKFVSLLTKELGIPTVVSMNPIMVDGTGMCGACRLTVGGEVKFACVDGPEFDGHLVDFDQAMKRQQQYKTEEGRAKLAYEEGATHHGGCGHCGGDK